LETWSGRALTIVAAFLAVFLVSVVRQWLSERPAA
jgi:hypothetical protein